MQLMDALTTRRTVRAYTDAPVSRETLQGLIDMAVHAPNGMNAQPWAFGVITGADALKGYSDRTKSFMLEMIKQVPVLERYRGMFENPESNLFYNAPACIIVFGKPGGATPEIDCTCAAYNIILAAHDRGLGTCWNGFFSMFLNTPEAKAELGIPEDYKAIAPIIIGAPADTNSPAPKNAPEMVFWK